MRLYTHTHTHTSDLVNNKKEEKGITLIALVITVIVLLILAGSAVSILSGENGILKQTVRAKEETEKASEKEKINLALLNWRINEKTTNEYIKDYLENEEESGLKNVKVIEENIGKQNRLIATIDGKVFILKSDGTYILTSSENLVNNGFLQNKNNENFEKLEHTDGYLSTTSDRRINVSSTDFIEIDNTKKYYQAINAKSNSQNTINYIGLEEYDIDKNLINSRHYMYIKNSFTYLEKDLKNGDTEVYLNDVSGFKVDENTPKYQRGFTFWNYKDSKGNKYPEFTYSRNNYEDLFNKDGIDTENNKIKLLKPWIYGTYSKGTKLSQLNADYNLNYGLVINKPLNKEWTTYENYIQGINTSGAYDTKKFNYATKYVKILLYFNFSSKPNVKTDIKNIIFAECE